MRTVTVVIPTFNRVAVIRRAIESVLAQTVQDFEVIVVDDGSTDGTASAVQAIDDARITLVRHPQNRGGSAARNTGIQAGSAPFIAFLDSDDEWLPTKLERQLEVFDRSGEQLALVYTGTERVAADGAVTRYIPRQDRDLTRTLLVENVIGETSVGMIRRTALEATGGFDETLPSCQDIDLWLRLAEQFQVDLIPEVLVRVAKGNDEGRISANVPRTLLGRDLYCRKHRAKMIRRGMLHRFLRETGWWQQRRVGNPRMARKFYVESLRANPFALLTYVLFGATFVPLQWMDQFASRKQRLTRVLSTGHPQPYASKDSSAS